MKNKTTDRRIRKTRNAIKNGLAELLLEKSIGDISVRELTEKVDLNRGTFYLHYKDIFDLVEQIETEMFEELQYIIDSHPAKEMNGEPLPLLEDIFNLEISTWFIILFNPSLKLGVNILSIFGVSVFFENIKINLEKI